VQRLDDQICRDTDLEKHLITDASCFS